MYVAAANAKIKEISRMLDVCFEAVGIDDLVAAAQRECRRECIYITFDHLTNAHFAFSARYFPLCIEYCIRCMFEYRLFQGKSVCDAVISPQKKFFFCLFSSV